MPARFKCAVFFLLLILRRKVPELTKNMGLCLILLRCNVFASSFPSLPNMLLLQSPPLQSLFLYTPLLTEIFFTAVYVTFFLALLTIFKRIAYEHFYSIDNIISLTEHLHCVRHFTWLPSLFPALIR